MNDFEVMRRARNKWVRECATANLPMPSEQALAAYHRGFLDALSVALNIAINEERHDAAGKCSTEEKP